MELVLCIKHAPEMGQVDMYDDSKQEILKKKKRKCASQTIWNAKATAMKIKKRRIEKQKAATCGIQAVNNALGSHVISREDVDEIVKKIGRGGDKNGNYSAEPLHCALQTKHFKLCRVKGKGHMWLSKQKKGKFLALGWHISYDRPAHYIGSDADIGIVIDGSMKNSFKLDVGGMLACLSGGLTRIWEIKPL